MPTSSSQPPLKRESSGVSRHGFQDDAVAEGLELGDGTLTLAVGVAPDEVVATTTKPRTLTPFSDATRALQAVVWARGELVRQRVAAVN